jgi:hypothetical protein
MAADIRRRSDYILWVELFVLINLAFLSADIFLAHSENDFRSRAEWIPFYFSLSTPLLLGVGLACRQAWNRPFWWSVLGYLVGSLAIAVGLAGVILHLDSSFFYERTVLSLTYAAPFAAPLAYAGLGFLLLLNRMLPARSVEWGQWLLLVTLGGFFGNFVLSVTDHAENGFFHWTEWIPVASSAVAVAFLALPFFRRVDGSYIVVCAFILLLECSSALLDSFSTDWPISTDLRRACFKMSSTELHRWLRCSFRIWFFSAGSRYGFIAVACASHLFLRVA